MTRPDTHAEIDFLAARYIREKDPETAQRLLGQLLFEHCGPLIRSIVGARLRSSAKTAQDLEDVCSEALLSLIGRIEDLRAGVADAVDSFSRYTAVMAYHACHDYRARFPQRHRLKNRLRYLLKPERGFDLWESPRGDWICGLRKWRDRGAVTTGSLTAPPDDLRRTAPAPLLAAVFERAGGPVEFDALVDLMADVWGVKDQVESFDPASARETTHPSGRDEEVLRDRLQALWKEIGELPRNQRVALLLNLRAEDEKCAMELFPLTGIASMRDIASLLEIPAEEFVQLWSSLPLDDRAIAERLGMTRQQVINLRKSARKRLERRMAVIVDWNRRRSDKR